MNRNAGVLLLFAVLLLPVGCARKTDGSGGKNEPAPAGSGSVAAVSGEGAKVVPGKEPETLSADEGTVKPAEIKKPERSLTLKAADTDLTASGEPVRVTQIGTGNSDFLSNKTVVIIPEDMAIGPLQDRFGENAETLNAPVKTIASFFDAYRAGGGWQSYLDPDLRLVLERSIQDYSKKSPSIIAGYRMGKMDLEENTCSCNIRLFSAAGRTEGELYLEKKDDTWYISDIQADLAALQKPYEQDDVFEPNIYRWLAVP